MKVRCCALVIGNIVQKAESSCCRALEDMVA